jgi:hypothetical protein
VQINANGLPLFARNDEGWDTSRFLSRNNETNAYRNAASSSLRPRAEGVAGNNPSAFVCAVALRKGRVDCRVALLLAMTGWGVVATTKRPPTETSQPPSWRGPKARAAIHAPFLSFLLFEGDHVFLFLNWNDHETRLFLALNASFGAGGGDYL